MFDIRPIRTAADHAAALAEIDRLWTAEPGSAEAERLEVIATLVGLYEDATSPIDPPDPVAAIHFHIDQGRLTQADLARVFGSRARASEVLARKRRLTVAMIWALHREFGIPARSLVQPYVLATPGTARSRTASPGSERTGRTSRKRAARHP